MTSNIREILKYKLKFYRTKQGLTQEKLSELSGISTDYISELERGKKLPSIKRLDIIANALNTEIYKFFIKKD